MVDHGIKNVGGHFRFQELVMTKGIHIVNSCHVYMIQLLSMVQFSSSKS